MVDDAVNDTPSIVPYAFSVYVAFLVTVLVFEMVSDDFAVAGHDAMRVLPFHSSSVALIFEPAFVMLSMQVAVVPLNVSMGRGETVRASAALAVDNSESARTQTNKIAINRLFIKTPPSLSIYS